MNVHHRSILIFALGCLLAVLLWTSPTSRNVLLQLDSLGYFAALIAGILYGATLASVTGSVLFLHLTNVNPFLAAIIGGFGALLYDLLVLNIVSSYEPKGIVQRFHQWIVHRKLTRATAYTTGALIIASPLPDELGIALLGISSLGRKKFMALSFALNTLGILTIIILGRL